MKHKHAWDLETMDCFECNEPITASGYVKTKSDGLLNMTGIIEMTGRDRI